MEKSLSSGMFINRLEGWLRECGGGRRSNEGERQEVRHPELEESLGGRSGNGGFYSWLDHLNFPFRVGAQLSQLLVTSWGRPGRQLESSLHQFRDYFPFCAWDPLGGCECSGKHSQKSVSK
jgi:hypothetical protein